MQCQKCGGKTKVTDSRADSKVVVRVRKCCSCGEKVYTTEYSDTCSHYEFNRVVNEMLKQKRRCLP